MTIETRVHSSIGEKSTCTVAPARGRDIRALRLRCDNPQRPENYMERVCNSDWDGRTDARRTAIAHGYERH